MGHIIKLQWKIAGMLGMYKKSSESDLAALLCKVTGI